MTYNGWSLVPTIGWV